MTEPPMDIPGPMKFALIAGVVGLWQAITAHIRAAELEDRIEKLEKGEK